MPGASDGDLGFAEGIGNQSVGNAPRHHQGLLVVDRNANPGADPAVLHGRDP